MSNSNTNSPDSKRANERLDNGSGQLDSAVPQSDDISIDEFVESAGFLPDWLQGERVVRKRPEVKVAHNSQPGRSEPKDDLLVEPEALDEVYDSKPIATAFVDHAERRNANRILPLLNPLPGEHQAEPIPELIETNNNNNTADFAPTVATMTPTITAPPAITGSQVEAIVQEDAPSSIAETQMIPAASPKRTRRRMKGRRSRSTWTEGNIHRVPVQIFDRFAQTLMALLFTLGLLTLFIFWFDPFVYFALQSATVGRPQTPRKTADLPVQAVQWCLMGDFSSESEPESRAMSDNGEKGDTVAGDRIFTIIHPIAEPGTHLWQVAPCNDPQNLFPPEPTWVVTTLPDQPVSFTFDLRQTNSSRYIASDYVIAASDSANQFQLIGDFQNWNPNDPAATMQPVGAGIYQQVRHISEPGRYNAYVITDPLEGETVVAAIDGYGRTTQPIPLSFRTFRSSDLVIVRLDTNLGRATVLYNMNPLLAQIAFNNGSLIAGTVVGAVALLITFWLLLRSFLLWRHRSWLDAGCPRCHEHELMRIERLSTDRLLHKLGLPAFRYQCRHCAWQGARLSIGGLSSSPKSRLARAQQV